jgi:hypothetical protein
MSMQLNHDVFLCSSIFGQIGHQHRHEFAWYRHSPVQIFHIRSERTCYRSLNYANDCDPHKPKVAAYDLEPGRIRDLA